MEAGLLPFSGRGPDEAPGDDDEGGDGKREAPPVAETDEGAGAGAGADAGAGAGTGPDTDADAEAEAEADTGLSSSQPDVNRAEVARGRCCRGLVDRRRASRGRLPDR